MYQYHWEDINPSIPYPSYGLNSRIEWALNLVGNQSRWQLWHIGKGRIPGISDAILVEGLFLSPMFAIVQIFNKNPINFYYCSANTKVTQDRGLLNEVTAYKEESMVQIMRIYRISSDRL